MAERPRREPSMDGDEYVPPTDAELYQDEPVPMIFRAQSRDERPRSEGYHSSLSSSSTSRRRERRERRRRRRELSRSRSRHRDRQPIHSPPYAEEAEAEAEGEAAAAAAGAAAAEAAPNGEDDEPADEPQVFKSRHVDFDLYEQDPNDPITRPKFCVYCHVAMSTKQQEMNNLLANLLNLQRHHRPFMDPLAFCRMQQTEYNDNVRKHIVDKNGRRFKDPRGAPAMHARHFWEHHIHHIYSPSVFHEEMAREVSSNILLMLQNGCKMKTNKRGVYVDDDKFWNVARIYDKFKPLLTKVGTERDMTLFGAT